MKKDLAGSKTLPVALLLALAGGFLDGYTYSVRGGVFANAQTGNLVKLGMALANGNHEEDKQFIFPILAFILGVVISMSIERHMKAHSIPFIRRGVLLIEILAMLGVAAIPQGGDSDIMANVLVSFLCAMQMETFRTFLDGEAIATTVSTGNLRKMVEKLYKAATKRSRAAAISAGCYFLVIAVFVSGAFLGTWLSGPLSVRAVLFPAGLLLAAFAVITANRRRRTAASGV